jgi:hypothetical protein
MTHRIDMFRRFLLLGCLLFWPLGCDLLGPDEPRGPGIFSLAVLSPHGAEGSAVLAIKGGEGLGAVWAEGGEALYQRAGGSIRVVVVLDDPGQLRLRVRTEEIREHPEAELLQVADGNNRLRSSLAGYSIAISGSKGSPGNGGGGS